MQDSYRHPIFARGAGQAMQEIFSPEMSYRIWRRLWLALAETEANLGLDISEAQLNEMREHLDEINQGFAALKERELKQEVAAHLAAFGAQCPKARPVIGLGATASFVRENGEIIRLRAALIRVKSLLVNAIAALADFSEEQRALPCLSYIRFQPSMPITLGKRSAVWTQDLLMDLNQIDHLLSALQLIGCRGENGASPELLQLFSGEGERVRTLEQSLGEKLGFSGCYPISGPLVSRKIFSFALRGLAGISESIAAMSNDLRLMIFNGELLERPGDTGFSAKPLKSERLSGLSRFVICAAQNGAQNAASHCLEQCFDDEYCRNVSLPESFLAVDSLLCLLIDLIEHCGVNREAVLLHLAQSLPSTADMESMSGLSCAQIEAFLNQVVDPLLQCNQKLLGLEIPEAE